jgi:phosphopantothenoylcysteine decarboxylase/phosphopantothenate--cysteine ligase
MHGVTLSPRRPWQSRRIVLGVTAGIAAYKAVQLARDLTLLGAEVDVVLTHGARSFVGALSFEGVTGRQVYGEILTEGQGLAHIRLASEAHAVCIAPATADFMARAAAGRADDLLTAILLATRAPVLICPAMNDRMFAHTQTQLHLKHLEGVLRYHIVGPATGPLAYDEGSGPGRLEEGSVIIEHLGRALGTEPVFAGKRVVVTAGPTREAIDPVRFLSNRSSGLMGYHLAAAAWRRGAEVILIAGPTKLPPPAGPTLVRVETAEDVRREVDAHIGNAHALIMAAAVADFRPSDVSDKKIKKGDGRLAIPLEPTPDVLTATRKTRARDMITIGFALETDNLIANATAKRAAKELDLIVLNDVRNPDAGFEVETNQVVLINRDGAIEKLPMLPKAEVAESIVDRLALLLRDS